MLLHNDSDYCYSICSQNSLPQDVRVTVTNFTSEIQAISHFCPDFPPPKLQIILRYKGASLCSGPQGTPTEVVCGEWSAIQTPLLLWFQIHVQVYWGKNLTTVSGL